MIRQWSNTLLLTTLLIIKLVCIQYALDLIQNVIYLAVAIGCRVRKSRPQGLTLRGVKGRSPPCSLLLCKGAQRAVVAADIYSVK